MSHFGIRKQLSQHARDYVNFLESSSWSQSSPVQVYEIHIVRITDLAVAR